MTAQAVPRRKRRMKRRTGTLLTLPFVTTVLVIAAAATFVSYVLWPTWPSGPVALDAPSIPITVAGVLFDVPPAAIRIAVQRHAGQQERIDLAFDWPSLTPPQPDNKPDGQTAITADNALATAAATESKRLFVTVVARGSELPPLDRLRTIYPRYVEKTASAGPDGLAVLPFRAGTPYDGQDLLYVGSNPEQFFALCSRPAGALPGTCIQERALDAAEITLRFPRSWFGDWRTIADGFDRLLAQLHPPRN